MCRSGGGDLISIRGFGLQDMAGTHEKLATTTAQVKRAGRLKALGTGGLFDSNHGRAHGFLTRTLHSNDLPRRLVVGSVLVQSKCSNF